MPRKVQIALKSGLKKECILLDNRVYGDQDRTNWQYFDGCLLKIDA